MKPNKGSQLPDQKSCVDLENQHDGNPDMMKSSSWPLCIDAEDEILDER